MSEPKMRDVSDGRYWPFWLVMLIILTFGAMLALDARHERAAVERMHKADEEWVKAHQPETLKFDSSCKIMVEGQCYNTDHWPLSPKPVAKRHAEKPAVQCDLTFKNGGPEKGFVQYDGIPGIEVGTDIPYVGVVKLCREGKWVVPEPTVSPAEKPANHSWINDRCQWRYDGKSDAPIMQCDPTVPLGTAQEPLLGETGLITYDQLPEDTKTYLRSHWPNSYPPCTGACGKHDEACEKRCRAAEHCPAVDSVSQ